MSMSQLSPIYVYVMLWNNKAMAIFVNEFGNKMYEIKTEQKENRDLTFLSLLEKVLESCSKYPMVDMHIYNDWWVSILNNPKKFQKTFPNDMGIIQKIQSFGKRMKIVTMVRNSNRSIWRDELKKNLQAQ